MSSVDPIGGYLELELPPAHGFLHDNGLLLNSGRACFEYVLRTTAITKVHMPKYTCDVMLEPLDRLGIDYAFYSIDDELKIASLPEISESEAIVYTNYFGVMNAYCRTLSERNGNRLILDFSQAFYEEPLSDSHVFYSPRKFFGLPDGGILFSKGAPIDEALPTDVSYDRCMHLLKRIDQGAEAGYEDFKNDDAQLSEVPLSYMSSLTRRLLGSIDMSQAREQRNTNFHYLHERLAAKNILQLDAAQVDGPLCYPFQTNNLDLRKRLIDNKIFVATYWPNVREWCTPDETEYSLTETILPLPIDQRYNVAAMDRMLEVLNG